MIIQITSLMIFLQILSGCGDNVDVCSPEYVNKKEQYIVSELKKIFEECNIPVEYGELGSEIIQVMYEGPVLKDLGLSLPNSTNNNFALGQFINFKEWKSYIQKTLNNITEDSKIGFMDFSNIIVNVDRTIDRGSADVFSTVNWNLMAGLYAVPPAETYEELPSFGGIPPFTIDHSSGDLPFATQEKSYNEIIILDENISKDLKLQLKDTETELQKLEKFLDFINNYKNKKISNVLDTVSDLESMSPIISDVPIGTTEKVLLTVCNLLFPILLKESERGSGSEVEARA